MSESTLIEDPLSTSKAMEGIPQEIQQGSGTVPAEGDGRSGKLYQPIQSRSVEQGGASPRHGLGSRSSSIRSYGDGHGFSCVGDDEKAGHEDGQVSNNAFKVQWDGDNDPMNPRSMGKARKWVIVLVVSTSSLCVYVMFLVVTMAGFQSSGLMLVAKVHVHRLSTQVHTLKSYR